MVNVVVSEKGRSTALVAAGNVNLFAKQRDHTSMFFKPNVPALPKFAPSKPLLGGPMPNLSGGPIPAAPSPAGGLLSALFPLAILAMLATALRKMVGKIIKPNKQIAPQPAH
ncbi:MAG: hypothetical protein Q7T16_03195 [Candidatus Burarchaeum sp.]|nr:hypothetical protein [Candidatus Burarchaeum sp.]MDO8339639.1 hypothetical protein [Candidatus Burarchaeum sp.]